MSAKNPIPPENVGGPSGVNKPKGFEQETQIKPNQEEFQAYMKEPLEQPAGTPETGAPSPMDIAGKGQGGQGTVSIESILNQTSQSENLLNTLQNNLNTPNLKLKRSHQKLLNNKLQDANRYLSSAADKLGLPKQPPSEIPSSSGPIAKFLGYITDGQNQIAQIKQKISEVSQQGQKGLNPGEMLSLQVKISQAQQEIEYSSVLLSKVVDALKQTLNIQI